jgi:hypothetical protein
MSVALSLAPGRSASSLVLHTLLHYPDSTKFASSSLRITAPYFLVKKIFEDLDLGRLPDLAKELVGVKPDVIVTTTVYGVSAVKNATRTIPVVMTLLLGGLVYFKRIDRTFADVV